MASNPAFNRIEKDAKDGYAGFGGPGASAAQQSAAAQAATAGMSAQQLQDLYNQPSAGPVDTRRVTMDDVIMKTLAPLRDRARLAAGGWAVAANNPTAGSALWIGGMIGTLVHRSGHRVQEDAQRPADPALRRRRGPVHGGRQPVLQRGLGSGHRRPGGARHAGDLRRHVPRVQVRPDQGHRQVPPDHDHDDLRLRDLRDRQLHLRRGLEQLAVRLRRLRRLGIAISVFAVGLASFTLALDFDSIEGRSPAAPRRSTRGSSRTA